MNVSYKREMDRSYMVVEDPCPGQGRFQLKMLQQAGPQGFLGVSSRNMNGQVTLMYDITSLQNISQLYERRGMSGEEIIQLLKALETAIETCSQYLLEAEDIVLQPDMIYRKLSTGRYYFCYMPGYGEKAGDRYKAFAEYILKHLTHSDRSAVEIGYFFYDQVNTEHFSFLQMMQNLSAGTGADISDEPQDPGIYNTGQQVNQDPGIYNAGQRVNRDPGMYNTGQPNAGQPAKRNSGMNGGGRPAKQPQPSSSGPGDSAFTFRYDDSPREKREENTDQSRNPSENRRKRKRSGKKKQNRSKSGKLSIPVIAACAAGISILFGLIVYFAKLDLTQTGGLFFLMVSVSWLVIGTIRGKRKDQRSVWDNVLPEEEEEEEEDEEEAFLQALISEVYREVPPGRYPESWPEREEKKEYPLEEEKEDIPVRGRKTGYPPAKGKRGFFKENPAAATYASYAGGKPSGSGETRVLAGGEEKLCLISQDPRKCRDLFASHNEVLIGKRSSEVDLCIGLDVISGIHAKIMLKAPERDADGRDTGSSTGSTGGINGAGYGQKTAFLTDLNSTNGTFLNGERLIPYEPRQVREGDLISFATVQFKLRMG